MANLKNINFMSQSKFNTLTETADDELYAVSQSVVGMPDYSAGVDKNANVTHTAEEDGFVFWQALNTLQGTFYVNNVLYGLALGADNKWADSNSIMIPVSKGDTYNCTGASTFIFYPSK